MRQVDRYVKWSINTKGYIKYKDILEQRQKQGLNE